MFEKCCSYELCVIWYVIAKWWRIIYKTGREHPVCACWVAATSTYAMVVGHVCLCKNVCMKET